MGKDNDGCFYGFLYKEKTLSFILVIVVKMEYDGLDGIVNVIRAFEVPMQDPNSPKNTVNTHGYKLRLCLVRKKSARADKFS